MTTVRNNKGQFVSLAKVGVGNVKRKGTFIMDVVQEVETEEMVQIIDDPETMDNHRRINEMELHVSTLNKENLIAEAEKAIVDLRKKASKIEENEEKQENVLFKMGEAIGKKRDEVKTLRTAYNKRNDWLNQNMWVWAADHLVRRSNGQWVFSKNAYSLIEDSKENFMGDVGKAICEGKRLRIKYDVLAFNVYYDKAVGVDEKGHFLHLADKTLASIDDIAKGIDIHFEDVDDIGYQEWMGKEGYTPMSQWTEEEIIFFLDNTDSGSGVYMAKDLLLSMKAIELDRVARKAKKALEVALEDDSEIEEKIAAGVLQNMHSSLRGEVDSMLVEAEKRTAKKKINSEKWFMERVVAGERAHNGETDEIVDFIKVEEFWDIGEASCTDVRPIYKTELPFMSEILKGASIKDLSGSISIHEDELLDAIDRRN